jgi:hypothetical protein
VWKSIKSGGNVLVFSFWSFVVIFERMPENLQKQLFADRQCYILAFRKLASFVLLPDETPIKRGLPVEMYFNYAFTYAEQSGFHVS